jgi:hypothetical protein
LFTCFRWPVFLILCMLETPLQTTAAGGARLLSGLMEWERAASKLG